MRFEIWTEGHEGERQAPSHPALSSETCESEEGSHCTSWKAVGSTPPAFERGLLLYDRREAR